MKKIRVYIASPYRGDQAANVRKQIEEGHWLFKIGFYPYIPELNHFVTMICPMTSDEIMELDLSWLEVCDVLLRLPGESKGADIEVEYALKLGKKVFYSWQELHIWDVDTRSTENMITNVKLSGWVEQVDGNWYKDGECLSLKEAYWKHLKTINPNLDI